MSSEPTQNAPATPARQAEWGARFARAARVAILPLLALVTLLAWMFASPIGAAPDDDFHLVSTWCATPIASDECAPGSQANTRIVSSDLVGVACYAQNAQASAACQSEVWALGGESTETDRGNFVGAYPPVYYTVMSAFATADVQTSALVMRFVTIVLVLALIVVMYAALPVPRRATLLWMWLIVALPLGVFLLASNNPSAWAIAGVATAWLSLVGWYEQSGRARIALGVTFGLGVLMAAGARGDGALYVGFAIAVAMGLSFEASRRFVRLSILPVIFGFVALFFFVTSRQVGSGFGGFGGGSASVPGADGADAALGGIGLLAYNVLNLPFLWSGVLGTWGLGWLDTSMPWIVPLAVIAVFVSVGMAGLGVANRRTLWAVLAAVAVLVVVPLYTLQAGGDQVGDQVQPRYLFPLIILLAGLLVFTAPGRRIALAQVPAWTIVIALSGAHLVALHMNLRRYVTGIDGASPNLDAGLEWWWSGFPVGPTVVWLLGSAAFATLVAIVVPRLAAGRDPLPEFRLPVRASRGR